MKKIIEVHGIMIEFYKYLPSSLGHVGQALTFSQNRDLVNMLYEW